MDTPWFAVLFWLLALPTLWGVGSLASFRLRQNNALFAGVLTLSLGLICLANYLIFTAAFNFLKPFALVVFFGIVIFLSRNKLLAGYDWCKSVLFFFRHNDGAFSLFCLCALLGAFGLTLVICFFPEIANDALAIQLYLAKVFVRNSSLTPSYLDIASFRPLLMSVFYTTGLFFNNVAIAKLFHWLCGFLLVLALMTKINETTQSKKLALFFGLMLFLTPTLINQITTTYIDAGVSLFVFLAFCLTLDKNQDLRVSNFFYGGLFLGTAVAMRYLALGAYFSIMIILALRFILKPSKQKIFNAAFIFSIGTLLASGYWFARAWVYTGNPVYPYLGSLFGTEDYSLFSKIYFYGMGLPRTIWTFLGLPMDMTLRPQYFDYHHWIGPIYLLVFPVAVYSAIKVKQARQHLFFTLLFTTFWYFTGQNSRYLLPAFPIYLWAVAMGISSLSSQAKIKPWIIASARVCAYLVIFFLILLTVRHFRFQFLSVAKGWDAHEYSIKMERTRPVADWVNTNLPQNAKLLILEEPRLFYFEREVILEPDFDIRTHYTKLDRPADILQTLKKSGITHIVDSIPAVPDSHELIRPIDAVLRDSALVQEEASVDSQNIIEKRFTYKVYALK